MVRTKQTPRGSASHQPVGMTAATFTGTGRGKAGPEEQYMYKARHAHKRLYTVLPKYSKIQVLPGITSCRLVKDNKQAIELNSLLLNNMPEDGYE